MRFLWYNIMLYSDHIQTRQLHANDHASVMQQMLKKDNDCTSRFPLLAVQTPLLHTWGGRSVQGIAGKVSEFKRNIQGRKILQHHDKSPD
jgi:hypothetical protein